jgi:L-asparaginase/Glu-tRNA(Gln) amidotransferase subunit D
MCIRTFFLNENPRSPNEQCECIDLKQHSISCQSTFPKHNFLTRTQERIRNKFKKARVYIIETGGTFASEMTEQMNLSPRSHIGQLLTSSLKKSCNLAHFSFAKPRDPEHVGKLYDSINSDQDKKMRLASLVIRALTQKKSDAIFITHGTDTMADSAAFLSLLIPAPSVPVFLIGGMKPANSHKSDAVSNFYDATIAAQCKNIPPGFYVICNHKIIPAHEVTKINGSNTDSFRSIRSDKKDFARVYRLPFRGFVKFPRQESAQHSCVAMQNSMIVPELGKPLDQVKINIIQMSSHYSPKVAAEKLAQELSVDVDGFIIKGFGSGAVGEAVLNVLSDFSARKPIVLTSRIPLGTFESATYEAAEFSKMLPILFGDGLTTEWAEFKLMLLIAQYSKKQTNLVENTGDCDPVDSGNPEYFLSEQGLNELRIQWFADKAIIQGTNLPIQKKNLPEVTPSKVA